MESAKEKFKKNDWFGIEERAFERVEQAIKEKKVEKLDKWLGEFGKGKGLIDFDKEFGEEDYL